MGDDEDHRDTVDFARRYAAIASYHLGINSRDNPGYAFLFGEGLLEFREILAVNKSQDFPSNIGAVPNGFILRLIKRRYGDFPSRDLARSS
jgi:hypothetical protein